MSEEQRTSEEDSDPIANTMAFRAFVSRGEPAEPQRRRIGPIVAGVTVVAVIVALVVWLALS